MTEKNKKLFIVCMFLLLAVPLANAVTCTYKTEPFLETFQNKIWWVCRTDETACLSYVKYGDRLIQANPEPEKVNGVGVIDKFKVSGGIVKVYFTKKNLRHDINFTFGVQCGDENLEAVVKPQYEELYEVQDQLIRVKDSTKFIVLGVFILIFLIIIIGVLIRQFRRR